MDIPHTTSARPDTGLWNAKIGIWLFLASEVMLFGGLFSAYVFLRIGAGPGQWPHGLLNVPVGTANTAILIASSVTVVLAWAALKMRQFTKYRIYMGITIACGVLFLVVKLAYEWPQKFHHFGMFIKPEAWANYEPQLGNQRLKEKGLPPRMEISGHLEEIVLKSETDLPADGETFKKYSAYFTAHHIEMDEHRAVNVAHHATAFDHIAQSDIKSFKLGLDPVNADPEKNDRPHFRYEGATHHMAEVKAEDVKFASMFKPKHSPYFATYFTITGLHGLHVLGGVLVFLYFWLPGAKLYKTNPEHLANRVEVAGLFWHFVDLVWIFVFPLFYLL